MPYDMAKDQGRDNSNAVASQARRAISVVPNDTDDFAFYLKCLYVGTPGDLMVLPTKNDDNTPVLLKNHPIGYVPLQVRRVLATGTTADNIVGLL